MGFLLPSLRITLLLGVSSALLSAIFVSADMSSYGLASADSRPIRWSPCFDNPNAECGSFTVYRDWTNGYRGNFSLAVVRYKSTAETRLGTLWVNPGGPGLSGVGFLGSGMGERISAITGGVYDVASWDPRGVNKSLPSIECFTSPGQPAALLNDTIFTNGIEVTGNFSVQADIDAFYQQQGGLNDLLDNLNAQCTKITGEGDLEYVGTVATVFDLLAMTDAVDGNNAPVNYWGLGYGTIIGTYLANMFPDRVGRMVLDGVMDPVLYSNAPAYTSWSTTISDAEQALHGFASSCIEAGNTTCALANVAKDADGLFKWVVDLVGKAYAAKKKDANLNVTSAEIRSTVYEAMLTPNVWSDLATWLASASRQLSGNNMRPTSAGSKAVAAGRNWKGHFSPERHPGEARMRRDFASFAVDGDDHFTPYAAILDPTFVAISCGDGPNPNYATSDVFDEVVNVTRSGAQLFGPQAGFSAMWYCHRWSPRASARYSGPWNKPLKNPILIVGNSADPVTPLASAKTLAQNWGSSAYLIEQQGYGHTSFAMQSNCTETAIGTYFINGNVPASSTLQCPTTQNPFMTNITLQGVDMTGQVSPVPIGGLQSGSEVLQPSQVGFVLVFMTAVATCVLCL